MGTFGWAYIGCGGIAHTTAKELVKTEDQKIVATWNRTYEKAEAFTKKYGGTAYRTIEEAINAPGVDGVYIAVTADKHAEYMRLCIKHHKPVLCEKPFTVNAGEAEEIFTYAAQEGVYVSEAMWTWHNAVAHKVRETLNSGKLGKIQSVDCAYAFPMLKFSRNPRLMNPAQAGGALMDIGIYAVRYCYELFGMPKELKCAGRTQGGADLGEIITMKYDGFEAKLTVAFDRNVGEYFRIKGTKGSVDVPMFHMASKATLNGEAIKDDSAKYAVEFRNVAQEIREGRKEGVMIPASATIDCMKLLDECRRQMGVIYPSEMNQEEFKDMKIQSFSHLGFNCKDIDASMKFYCDIMGCKKKFVFTYGDVADNIAAECKRDGKKEPAYLGAMRKRMGNTLWNVYLEWIPGTFIELFYVPSAKRKRIPGPKDLNFTHYSLAVEDLKAFRNMIIARGGAQYLDSEISLGLDHTYQMWMHDPDGNKFEVMEYTKDSLQFAEEA